MRSIGRFDAGHCCGDTAVAPDAAVAVGTAVAGKVGTDNHP